ncbi:D-aminoacylase [Shewanella sp. Scap07]|uniref:N-acyl-D-amino-acid deacylase family protein n=1 Tax=Shewanella sp. Scap07 TaxID=2589987 RepID=UPI0015C10023|nr:D-aminoacylase [Shewanella sp. Scap07]QLE87140.1 D-aminoacylase [Shewanella sp. Scap07]
MITQVKPAAITVIQGAQVFDGTGAAPINTDVAICGDQIVHVGCCEHLQIAQVIAAHGLALAPGFIDVHTHDDLAVMRDKPMQSKLSQGVTSVIVGNCGISASPALADDEPLPDPINLLGDNHAFTYATFADYANAIAKAQPAVNVGALVGHTTLRWQAMDDLTQCATPEQMQQMRAQLNLALSQGALGFSTGLAYHNAQAASAAEVHYISQDLADYGAIYTTHLRTEFAGILDAMTEAFDLGKAAQVPVVISHLKCAGVDNWGRAPEIVAHLAHAQQHQQVSCDCYPYTASSSTLDLNQVTDDFDIFITWSTPHPEMAGQNLADIAHTWQLSLTESAKRLQPAGAVYHCMSDDDVSHILSQPTTMVGSDGLPCDPHPHPRLWGTFPRVLGHYVRETQCFELSEAIYKMTGLAASQFNLAQRGKIAAGYFADLVLFNPETVNDSASYENPKQAATGIEQVWVNGQLSYQQAQGALQVRAGQLLTRSFTNPKNDSAAILPRSQASRSTQ